MVEDDERGRDRAWRGGTSAGPSRYGRIRRRQSPAGWLGDGVA